MPVLAYQREKCLKVVEKLLSYSVGKMFAQPVDPVRDNVPNYFDVIKYPMDLGTIKKKLNQDEYDSVAQWQADMELVWTNSFTISPKTSILGLITEDMRKKYVEMSEHISDDPVSDWHSELSSFSDQFNQIMKESTKKAKPLPKETVHQPARGHSGASKASKAYKTSAQTKVPPPAPAAPTRNPKTRDISKIDDIIQMTEEINSLKEDVEKMAILDILRKYEPNISDADTQVELDIKSLKPATLHALREKLDVLKKNRS